MTDEPNRAALDYGALVRFLMEPLLVERDALRVDCEQIGQSSRFVVRVAFAPSDRPHVLGRHGRAVQSMRSVLEFAAQNVGQTARLEVYGEHEHRPPVPTSETDPSKPRPRLPRPKPRPPQA
jgi:hypothetical protein